MTVALNIRPKPDQNEATKCKVRQSVVVIDVQTELEEAQRAGVKARKEKNEEWSTKLFHAGDGKEEEWYFNERKYVVVSCSPSSSASASMMKSKIRRLRTR